MSADVTWLALAAGRGLRGNRRPNVLSEGSLDNLSGSNRGRACWAEYCSNRMLMLTEAAAPRIVLIDSNGVTRAELGVSNEDSARLRIMDRSVNEPVRLDAGFGNQGPCFFFKDLHDKTPVAFCVRDDRTADLDLRGPDGKLLWSSAPAESSAVRPPIYSIEQSHPGNASPRSK